MTTKRQRSKRASKEASGSPEGFGRGATGVAPRAGSRPGSPRTVEFGELARDECEAVLARNNVGRLAFSFRDRVDIEPIHYVFSDGWLYGRTSHGSKLTPLEHNHWVAFEVDEVEEVFTWRSVVVHGAFYPLSPDGPEREAEAWARAIDLLRHVVPETWTSSDPVAFRTVVFRIYVDSMTGRAATGLTPEDKP